MSKMDEMRAQLDAQSTFAPNPVVPDDSVINKTIKGEVTRIHSQKSGIDANMTLAKRILDLNPELPSAFRSKFEAMAINAEFASCINGVINDCKKYSIILKMTEIKSNPQKIRKVGD